MGPGITDHNEPLAFESLRLAVSTVVCMCSVVNQLSHLVVAQCLMDATCASNARSSVPLVPAGTPAFLAMRAVLTPTCLRACSNEYAAEVRESLLKPHCGPSHPSDRVDPRSLATFVQLVLSEVVAITTACAMEGLEATALDFL